MRERIYTSLRWATSIARPDEDGSRSPADPP
jgi:hypothetical protein